jgi:hypothetical protein
MESFVLPRTKRLSDPNDAVTVEGAPPGGRVELRIRRKGSRSVVLTVAEARRVAEALMAVGNDTDQRRIPGAPQEPCPGLVVRILFSTSQDH